MGWSGGTEIFDCVVRNALYMTDDPEFENRLIGELYDILRDQDWDVVDECMCIDDPRIIEIIKQREPDWFEDEEDKEEMSEADRRFGQPHYGHDYREE